MARDTLQFVVDAIYEITQDIEKSQIVPGTLLIDDLKIDSLGLMELAMSLEEQLGISIREDQLLEFHTVKDIVNAIDTKR